MNGNNSPDVSEFAHPASTISYASLKSPHHETNQDSLAIFKLSNDNLVMLVSDGMGGHSSGEIASKIVCNTFKKELSKKSKNLRNKILDAIEKSNKEVRKLKVDAGATLTCCSIEKDKVRFYNVGDSGQILLGSRARLKFKGVEHSLLGHGIEAGIIKDRVEQELVDDNIISNGVGFSTMRIEMSIGLEIVEGDLIVLASDGVTGIMNEAEYIQWATSNHFNERIPNLISRFQNEEGLLQDDSSIIMYRHGK
jgi:protein phosphatase